MRRSLLLLLLLSAACATTTTSLQDAMAPCSRARLAREYGGAEARAQWSGCYAVVDGPDQLRAAGLVVLTELVDEDVRDEAPRFRLATTKPFVPAFTTSWEQLSPVTARLSWLEGTKGVEMCLVKEAEDAEEAAGVVVVVDDQPPFAHAVGPVRLRRAACPS